MSTRRTWCVRAQRFSSAAAPPDRTCSRASRSRCSASFPWRGVPYIPVEIMLLPKWFFFHLDKVSYWSRTVMVPLFILCSRKARAKNPRDVHIRELFTTPPEEETDYFRDSKQAGALGNLLLFVDRLARSIIEPLIPRAVRARATRRAEAWMLERLNGEDGLGAIFPAMVNALEVMTILGYPRDDPRRVTAKRALQKLLVIGPTSAYCQPCVSPVWDTALSALAMQAVGCAPSHAASTRALDWLQTEQLLDEPGDWQVERPNLRGGGWAFQFANDYYPDLDDTAVVAWAMHQAPNAADYTESVGRALDWLVGMQSKNGGFAAFDADNTSYYLNKIPFADHGALLDPPTSDVSARVVTVLSLIGPPARQARARARDRVSARRAGSGRLLVRAMGYQLHLRHLVGADRIRAGRCGTAGSRRAARRRLAARSSEFGRRLGGRQRQLPQECARRRQGREHALSHRVGAVGPARIRRGELRCGPPRSESSLAHPAADGLWTDASFTAPGFPRVFYLKYHGYCATSRSGRWARTER